MTNPESPDDASEVAPKKSGKLKYLWVIGIAGYIGFLTYVGWEDLRGAITNIDYRYLVALVIIDIVVLWFRVGKWHIALPGETEITRLAFLSKAGGNLSPGRIGEFSPLLLQRFRSHKIGAWILLDRLLEAAATLILGLIGILAVVGIADGNVLLIASCALLLAILILSYTLMQESIIKRIHQRFQGIPPLNKLFAALVSVSRELRDMRPKIPLFLSMTLAATALDIIIAYLLCKSLGFDIPLTLLALVQVVHAITSVIPLTPNATGVPYAAAATLLHQIGGMTLQALALNIALRMLLGNAVFWSSFLIGIRTTTSTSETKA
jgi:uncharacterized protein (TIRG00374 family)